MMTPRASGVRYVSLMRQAAKNETAAADHDQIGGSELVARCAATSQVATSGVRPPIDAQAHVVAQRHRSAADPLGRGFDHRRRLRAAVEPDHQAEAHLSQQDQRRRKGDA